MRLQIQHRSLWGFLIIYVLLSPIALADDAVYIISGEKLIKQGEFKVIALENITSSLHIDSTQIYFYTPNFVYGVNSTSGTIQYKVKILNPLELKLTDNNLIIRTQTETKTINKTTGEIIQKNKYPFDLNNIYTLFGLSSGGTGTINNYYTYYNNSTSDNTKINKSGDNITGNLNMQQNEIINISHITNSYGDICFQSDSPGAKYASLCLNGGGEIYTTVQDGIDSNTIYQEPNYTKYSKNINLSGNNIIDCGNCLTNETMAHDITKYNVTGGIITGNISLNDNTYILDNSPFSATSTNSILVSDSSNASKIISYGIPTMHRVAEQVTPRTSLLTALNVLVYTGIGGCIENCGTSINMQQQNNDGANTVLNVGRFGASWENKSLNTTKWSWYSRTSVADTSAIGVNNFNSYSNGTFEIPTLSGTGTAIIQVASSGQLFTNRTAGAGIPLTSPDGSAHCIKVSNLNVITSTTGAC